MSKKVIWLIIILGVVSPAYSRDPFVPVIPITGEHKPPDKPPPVYVPPVVAVQGILWGTDNPRAIIDGEVYAEGDKLKNIEATLYKIKKNKAIIIYQDRPYTFTVQNKD